MTRLRQFIGDRRAAPRRSARLTVIFTLTARPGGAKASDFGASFQSQLVGYTRDISEKGIAMIVSSPRVGGENLNPGASLRVELRLPREPANIEANVVYITEQKVGKARTDWLIGAQITEISESDYARLSEFLQA